MGNINSDAGLVDAEVYVPGTSFPDLTIKEIYLNESILNPSVQTAVTCQSYVYDVVKNYDVLKNAVITINLQGRYTPGSDFERTIRNMQVENRIYRVDNRFMNPINIGQTEEFIIHACDRTLLSDAQHLVSKLWKCASPSSIVRNVLGSDCMTAGIESIIESDPQRDYVAENIHPFQVIAQQANVALDGGDPSFVHFMTYGLGGGGMHNFTSLKRLCANGPIRTYYHSEGGTDTEHGYDDPKFYPEPGARIPVMAFSFPCDFDYLTDLLNGITPNGVNGNTVGFMNPLSGFWKIPDYGLCKTGYNYKKSITNKGTAKNQDACETDVESHLLLRQARMALLDKDKVALRFTVPWDPLMHVGQIIRFEWFTKTDNPSELYGTGNYLVTALTHSIQLGGYSTTTMDCVSQTVGGGRT